MKIQIHWRYNLWDNFIRIRFYYYGAPTRWYRRSNGDLTLGITKTLLCIGNLNIIITHRKFYFTKRNK